MTIQDLTSEGIEKIHNLLTVVKSEDDISDVKRLLSIMEEIKSIGSIDLVELKRLAHEGLPDECIDDWQEIKFCNRRNSIGNSCKRCSNLNR